MTESAAQSSKTRTCRFPGCTRHPEQGEPGVGRPPEYCADPAHTRASAWRARRQLADQESQQQAGAGEEERPVDAARERASAIRAQVEGMIDVLNGQLVALVGELRTTGDPDAAAAQIEVMTAQAAEEVATANARASRAEQAQRAANSERADADAAAAEATAVADTAQARLGEAQAEIAAIERARDEMARTRDQLLEQLDQAKAERDEARDHMATVTAERDSARRDAEREHAHAEQRLADLRTTHTEHITNLRTELEQSREATQAERSRADRAEARLDPTRPVSPGSDGHG
ncbi:MAG: hypothetical protein H0U62_00325 [Actinobacteria bacterium]|nr:hypothetical protein [Actinomycetota bacterium]